MSKNSREKEVNELDKIIKKLKRGEISECNAIDDILFLFSVSPRYSISLVYTKNIPNGLEIALRSFITNASSKEEALGKALIYFNDEMKNYNLNNKVVLKNN